MLKKLAIAAGAVCMILLYVVMALFAGLPDAVGSMSSRHKR